MVRANSGYSRLKKATHVKKLNLESKPTRNTQDQYADIKIRLTLPTRTINQYSERQLADETSTPALLRRNELLRATKSSAFNSG